MSKQKYYVARDSDGEILEAAKTRAELNELLAGLGITPTELDDVTIKFEAWSDDNASTPKWAIDEADFIYRTTGQVLSPAQIVAGCAPDVVGLCAHCGGPAKRNAYGDKVCSVPGCFSEGC